MSDYSITAILSVPQEAGYFFPNRHFEQICGHDVYRVMVDKLEEISEIGKIVINTDSDRIKGWYARSGKVKVIDVYRAEPQEIEMELTSDRMTAAMLGHVEGEHFLQVGPIFPFLKNNTISEVIRCYDNYVVRQEDRSNDSIFTMRMLYRRYYDSDTDFIREDRPNTFVEDGILHAFNRTTFLASGNRKIGKKSYAYGVDEIENLAIDSEENYWLAVFVDENRRRFPRVFGR